MNYPHLRGGIENPKDFQGVFCQKSRNRKSEDRKSEDRKSEDRKSEDRKSEDRKSEDRKSEDRNNAWTKLQIPSEVDLINI